MNTRDTVPFGPYTVSIDTNSPGHAVVRRADGAPPEPTWYEMQHMARIAWGSHAWAVEMFPPASELVDTANMRHLWLVPDSIEVPNLATGASWNWCGE